MTMDKGVEDVSPSCKVPRGGVLAGGIGIWLLRCGKGGPLEGAIMGLDGCAGGSVGGLWDYMRSLTVQEDGS